MIVALIDNGSLEPAAHHNLRRVAAALSDATTTLVHAVSWKHSDRIAPADLGGTPAWTLGSFVRAMHALGQRDFLFVPFGVPARCRRQLVVFDRFLDHAAAARSNVNRCFVGIALVGSALRAERFRLA